MGVVAEHHALATNLVTPRRTQRATLTSPAGPGGRAGAAGGAQANAAVGTYNIGSGQNRPRSGHEPRHAPWDPTGDQEPPACATVGVAAARHALASNLVTPRGTQRATKSRQPAPQWA
eukprot:gene16429-biopygen5899